MVSGAKLDSLLDEIDQQPQMGRRCEFVGGQALFHHGGESRDFHIVVDGHVRLVKSSPGGTATMVGLIGPGRVVCSNAVYGCQPYCCGASFGHEGGTAVVVPRERLLRLVDERRGLWRTLMNEVTCRGVELCARVEEMGHGTVEHKVARVLLRLWDEHGQVRTPEGGWVPVHLSRRELAQLCGAREETVIRAMKQLERADAVTTAGDGFVLRNMVALRRADG